MATRRERPLKAAAPTAPERARRRVTRDLAVVVFALGFGGVELMFLGARPSALTFLGGLLLSPLVMRYDEARRDDP